MANNFEISEEIFFIALIDANNMHHRQFGSCKHTSTHSLISYWICWKYGWQPFSLIQFDVVASICVFFFSFRCIDDGISKPAIYISIQMRIINLVLFFFSVKTCQAIATNVHLCCTQASQYLSMKKLIIANIRRNGERRRL